MKKIVFLNSHEIHYFTDLYNFLKEKNKLKFEVWYCLKSQEYFDKEFNLKREFKSNLKFEHTFLKQFNLSRSPYSEKLISVINFDLHKRLKKLKKGSIIICHGWARFSNLYVLIFGKIYGLEVGLRSETPLNQENLNSSIKKHFKRIVLKTLFKNIDYFLYIGKQNKLFYENLDVPENKLIFTPYSVNNRFFYNYHKKNKTNKSLDVKNILFVGKLIHKKRPLLLPKFIKNLSSNYKLLVVGTGELENELKFLVNELNIKERVEFLGYKNQEELLKIFSRSDFFILPSGKGETWGLVANEAMNFNLPLILSETVGSSFDLIKKHNGIKFKCDDLQDLVKKFKFFTENMDQEKLIKEMSELRIKYSYDSIEKALISLL